MHTQNEKIQFDSRIPVIGGIGIIRLSCEQLQEIAQNSQKVNVMVTGILVVDKSITVELLESTVQDIKVYGKVQAEPDILSTIKKKQH